MGDFATSEQRFRRGDRVKTRSEGATATVTGPAPRGPRGEPAVNLDWDGDAGGPAYEHDLEPAPESWFAVVGGTNAGQVSAAALAAAGAVRAEENDG